MQEHDAYGLWVLVFINSAVFIFFAFSFTKPRTGLDWRGLGAFAAFVVALFTEMYGFPLTIYLLSGWLQSRFPELDLFSHESGHLWHTLLGLEGDPHFDILHIISNLLIIGGFFMLASAWHVLHRAQQQNRLATSGLYARVRHPQYSAFILIMFGFLVQWPTLLTLVMFPVLVVAYIRLAKREESLVLASFGAEYLHYRENTPAFIPKVLPHTEVSGH
ncbi:MAG: methyltransferase family protein [Marinobacterium sp.]|uniref:methyltransferase family protein n=1 Tax=Marinobacterium stanieri TaxID=49186 RepID=UPI003A90742A